jgi:hypothetical protein
VLNPDADPDGDRMEVCAWWTVADARDNPALRADMATTPWDDITAAADSPLAVATAGAATL